jgi:hypothetical protein
LARARAEEVRSIAEQLSDPEAKRTMLRIADDYERLAELGFILQGGEAIKPLRPRFENYLAGCCVWIWFALWDVPA